MKNRKTKTVFICALAHNGVLGNEKAAQTAYLIRKGEGIEIS